MKKLNYYERRKLRLKKEMKQYALVIGAILFIVVCSVLAFMPKDAKALDNDTDNELTRTIEVTTTTEDGTITTTDIEVPELPQEPQGTTVEPKSDEYYYELDLLARVIHCENSNEVDGEEACWKTGSVILNRIKNAKYPDSLDGVVYQKGQYDCTSKLYKVQPTDIEYEVAAELLNSGSILPEDVVFAAEFYQGSGKYDQEGNTIYCRQ